ncbi:RDD family protein [Sulfurovum sp. bin170]|uniref:RDD family protein n=1 Tax=Sulfurovum sp. bin170 TaxID=2695268 RepID=UPI0013DF4FFE|nr:RDD family protein [Sulfurovum sp. bin170]NEW60971.1 RDD family protein [Sulfurovum sp. bin170]
MAKQRFRDLKKGKITEAPKKKSRETNIPYANNKIKSKAAITDSFMLMMPIMYAVIYLVMDNREDFEENMLIGWLYILVPFITVQTLFMFFGNGQTPGYRNYRLKVVDINSLEKPPLFSIIFRNTAMVLSIITVVGWLMMFFRKDNRGLHDFLSNTAVIVSNESEK